MYELEQKLANIQRDNQYTVLKVLKEGNFGWTEKVADANGWIFVRKYFYEDSAQTGSEYSILSRLAHPLLPKVYDHYELAGEKVLIEEYIDGVRLSDVINRNGRLPLFIALSITLQLCSVVEFLHSQRPNPVIHRDIKPDNIILQPNGQIKLIDFGAARNFNSVKNRDTVLIGTVGYAPPEQFGFGQTDCRADIYAIGKTLTHMLTGIPPERGRNNIPPSNNIPPQLIKIIKKATEFDPDHRYGSVKELSEEIKVLMPKRLIENKHTVRNTKPRKRIYPVYCNFPNPVKILLMPFHAFLVLLLVFGCWGDMITPTGFGFRDDLLKILNDLDYALLCILTPYILGFNLFNLNERIKFFNTKRRIKKTVIIIALIVIAGILSSCFESWHTAAYIKYANSAVS